ncbi:uncharacterized protein LOC110465421 isoform X2 [Mizuhopecten yessoensis]|uniref:uncharacterized protein LOC110465421 isoform X2 n=1 Tax=Mizuhopecten yessoensis TaxID=6573 RepID=UPI000B45C6E0|nr:uncharacterized protein LOC110465421 isoform X2 [Mizuhopecten yessoensis]
MTEMSQWIENTCIPALFIALMVYRTDAYSSVTLDASNCNSKTLYISHEQSQRIRWTGEVIPARCRVGFEATEAPHAVCVDIEIFRVDHCFFTLGIYENLAEYPVKRYDCASTDTTEELCFDHKRIYLGFTFNSTGEFSNPSVKIKVKVKKDENAESGMPTIGIILIVIGLIPGTFAILKYGCVCLHKCFCPMLRGMLDDIAECFCGETETATRNRYSSGETVPDEASRTITLEPSPVTTTETNGILSISGSMISLNDLAEEPLNPSATRTGNEWDPPPYVAPLPHETMIEAPPPSYYDVITYDD